MDEWTDRDSSRFGLAIGYLGWECTGCGWSLPHGGGWVRVVAVARGRMMHQLQDAFSKIFPAQWTGSFRTLLQSYDFIEIIHQIDADTGMMWDDDDRIQIF
jgi:hypothetical protein